MVADRKHFGQGRFHREAVEFTRGPATRLSVVASFVALAGLGGCHLVYSFVGADEDAARPDGPAIDGPTADATADGPTADATADGPTADATVDGPGGVVPGTWLPVPSGMLDMGAPTSEPCRSFTETLHQVTLTHGFVVQSTETTQGQFTSLMGYNPSFNPSCGMDCPVERVNWHESVAYCNALSTQAGKAPCYECASSGLGVVCDEAPAYSGQGAFSCPGYRLPTEAEWEYAYRAGTQTAFYNGGIDASTCSLCVPEKTADKIGWHCDNAGGMTHPVEQLNSNAWGLFDMAGNVWEWCSDWNQNDLGPYSATDPWGATTGTSRVARGGSWTNPASYLRAASRFSYDPLVRYPRIGFRCVRTLAP